MRCPTLLTVAPVASLLLTGFAHAQEARPAELREEIRQIVREEIRAALREMHGTAVSDETSGKADGKKASKGKKDGGKHTVWFQGNGAQPIEISDQNGAIVELKGEIADLDTIVQDLSGSLDHKALKGMKVVNLDQLHHLKELDGLGEKLHRDIAEKLEDVEGKLRVLEGSSNDTNAPHVLRLRSTKPKVGTAKTEDGEDGEDEGEAPKVLKLRLPNFTVSTDGANEGQRVFDVSTLGGKGKAFVLRCENGECKIETIGGDDKDGGAIFEVTDTDGAPAKDGAKAFKFVLPKQGNGEAGTGVFKIEIGDDKGAQKSGDCCDEGACPGCQTEAKPSENVAPGKAGVESPKTSTEKKARKIKQSMV